MLKEEIIYLIKDELLEVESLLETNITSEVREIPLIYKYTLKAGGKRFRPALVLLSGRLFSDSDKNKFIKLSTAAELLHMASLIHDDVVDDNKLRRGKVTANYRWGNKLSVFAADFMLLNIVVFLLGDFDPSTIMPFFQAVTRMCEGELFQIDGGPFSFPEEADYMNIIDCKTASLMSACCKVAARASGTSEENVESLARYGRYVGIAFQIVDDIMDLISTSQQMGKTSGSDLREGKITLPLIRALDRATINDRNRIQKLISIYIDEENVLEEILALINKYKGIDYSIKKAKDYVRLAMKELENLKDSRAKETLLQIGEYIISPVYN